jgi:DNA replication protein DnaC
VTSLNEWRLAHLPPATRPLPSVTPYDQLLRRRDTVVTTVREKHSDDHAPQRGLSEQAADAAIDTACRMLRPPSIRKEFSDIAERALKEQMSYRGFLAELMTAECDDRARRRSEPRIKAANFPQEKSLRAFDSEANPNIDAATVHALASCEWIKQGQPLCLIGDSGTGKSHMLITLGTEAAM